MATQAEPKTVETKADAAAEKAYAAAAETVSPKKADEAPVPAAPKIDAAVAEVKAAPVKAKKAPVRKAKAAAKQAPVKKAAAKKAAAPKTKKTVAKAKPAARPAAPKAAKIANPVTTTVSKLKDKIMANTKTVDFTETFKTAAADAQTRAKAAFDKLQAYAGEMTEFTKGNVEALVQSGKIVNQGVQNIARGEVEAAKGAFETATADLKAMAAVKSPAELFKLQGDIARRNFDAIVARSSKNAEVATKLANDAFAPLSSRLSVAKEKFSNAA